MTNTLKPNGAIIYRGPSLLDGAPIVVIATGLKNSSANAKTGDMIQTWIIRDDLKPWDAVKTGADASICGDCKHRGHIVDGKVKGRTCYVTVFQAPTSIYNAFRRGTYPDLTGADLGKLAAGRNVRIGAYGDPAAVPVNVWERLAFQAKTTTGYTHQWKTPANDALKYLTMASADTATEQAEAVAKGWRTFRVKKPQDHQLKGEVVCPSTTVGLSCADCGACKGKKGPNPMKGHIVINVHGNGAAAFA